ncbi:MAG TPA: cytochrome C [Thioploca sp.]|nr:cytochrome C [Thioploca sp.]
MKLIFILLVLSSYVVLADDDSSSSNNPGVVPVNDANYTEECGACHFAYQPGLLPSASWKRIMTSLEDHFGENAELETKEQKLLTDYLTKNAAEFSNYKRSIKIIRSLTKDKIPLRITEMPYIIKKHDELTSAMVIGNPEVKSLSYCDNCHTKAVTGSYAEDDIIVPGYGNWEEYEHSSSFIGRIKHGAKEIKEYINEEILKKYF